jgi:hypothetical protein
MTFPNAQIVDFNDPALPDAALEDTDHFHITTGILKNPTQFWKHLVPPTEDAPRIATRDRRPRS